MDGLEPRSRHGLSGLAYGRARRNRCIVFLHIPKTGGVTLKRALKWKYPSRTLYEETLTKPLEAFGRCRRASAPTLGW